MDYLTAVCYGETVIIILLLLLYLDIHRKQTECLHQYSSESFSSIRKLKEKPRKRYIVVEATGGSDDVFGNYRNAIKWLEESFKQLLGEIGLVNSGFTVIEYNPRNRRFIIRVYHHKLDNMLGVIGVHNSRNPVKLAVITVTGSVKKARSVQGKNQ
jgi:RNase P/RNase MRP subunit POP5